ncbi:hypothetical protein WAF17_21175 [Bernardetia sp. ABR2-2B]|uniref:hypothetical protein n=1 Tax=Bernardetia sp. ABR2-2B TaxID=3127472 RepID=UPI0030D3FA89
MENTIANVAPEVGIWNMVSEKILDGLVSVVILLVMFWFAKKFFEKFFDIFIKNVNDTREEYQATLKVKEEQVLSIIDSKQAIVKSVTDSFKESFAKIASEHTKQIEIIINDSRVGSDNDREDRKSKDVDLINSYTKASEMMQKSQEIIKNILEEQRRFQEEEREQLGKMMHDMEMRINQKLQAR